MAAYPYTVSTGALTVEQAEGEACVLCGKTFKPDSLSRPVAVVDGLQVFVHVLCPKVGATQ